MQTNLCQVCRKAACLCALAVSGFIPLLSPIFIKPYRHEHGESPHNHREEFRKPDEFTRAPERPRIFLRGTIRVSARLTGDLTTSPGPELL